MEQKKQDHTNNDNPTKQFEDAVFERRSLNDLLSAEQIDEKLRYPFRQQNTVPWSVFSCDLEGVGTIVRSPFHSRGLSSAALKEPISVNDAKLANFWKVSYLPATKSFPPIAYLRSGTPVHYGIKDALLRQSVTERNISELHQRATSCSTNGRLISIDLQSPDTMGEHLTVEKTTVTEKIDAMRRYPSSVSLVIPTHERSIEYSMNPGIITDQRRAFAEIISNALAGNHFVPLEMRRSLIDEVDVLLDAEDRGHTSTVGRYALAARLVLLTWIAGDVPHFHCRSGKDRTGFLDVEVVFLYLQMASSLSGRSTSDLGMNRLSEEELAWRTLLLSGGNLENQELNTGYRGSKLNQESLRMRVGADNWSEFIGESHLAES